jgi:hypothetical protein
VRFAQRTTAPHPHRRGRGNELVAPWRAWLGLGRRDWGSGREKAVRLRFEAEAEAVANAIAMARMMGWIGRRQSACACAALWIRVGFRLRSIPGHIRGRVFI